MSEYVIPTDDDTDVGVTVAVDPEYDYEAEQGHATIAFKQSPLGLIMGIAKGGRRLALRLDGFTPNIRNVTGSAVSFRQGNVIVTYQVNRRRVKERIRFLANPARDRFTFTAVITDGVHLEALSDGGIQVVDDVTGRAPMRMLPPDIVDNNGMGSQARYELSPDGQTITLILDLAWLAQAAYPVTIDPTTVTATTIDQWSLMMGNSSHVFRMADASLVALWIDSTFGSAGWLRRSRSTDGGATWSAPVIVYPTGPIPVRTSGGLSACHDRVGDVIYGVYASLDSSLTFGRVFKMAFAAGAFTDTSANTNTSLPQGDSGGPEGPGGCSVQWDATNSRLVIAYGWWFDTTGTGQTAESAFFEVWSSALAYISFTGVSFGGANSTSAAGTWALCLRAGVLFLAVTLQNGGSYWVICFRFTFNGTTIVAAPGTREFATPSGVGASRLGVDAWINVAGELEIFYQDWDGANQLLRTLRRTGTSTFTAPITLEPSAVAVDGFSAAGMLSICSLGDGTDDLYVFWRDTTGQANGEILYKRRTGGSWGSSTLLAGGANTGWHTPAATDPMYPADNFVYMLYLTGTTTRTLVFNNTIRAGSPPLTPTNILPIGTANTTLTPTVGGRYLNGNATDPMSSYQILVTRQSDSAVMWDSAKTAYGGSPITNGMDYSRAYGGSALAKNVTYLMQIRFWDNWGDLAGPYNSAQSFVINDAPAVAITSSAAPNTSGPTVVWTFTQTHSHAQASYRVRLLNPSSGAVVYDGGTIASASTSHGIPTGTLQNGVTYTLEVTATSTDGL